MTLITLLSNRAKKIPQKTCIKFKKKKYTYLEIDRLVSLTAGGLQELGLRIKDRIAILMSNCPEYIISYFAGLRAGGIVVPVNSFLTPKEVSYILMDSGCKILICSRDFRSYAGEIKKHLPDIKILTFDEIPQKEAKPYAGYEKETAVHLYTSGTTGFPKGVMLTHLNLKSNVEAFMKIIRVTNRDRMLLFLPLFHSFTFTVCVLMPIYTGASIVLLESVKPFSHVIKSILRDRITMFVAVPTVYNILARKKIPFFLRCLFRYFSNVRVCVSGAAALQQETVREFEKRFRWPLLEGYGLTEASPVVSVNPFDGVRKPSSVGPPLPGIEVAVIGDKGNRLTTGEPGELIVRGPNVMKGYFNKESETKDVLKDGWLYTGDVVKIDGDGYLYIVDRKKDLIIVDGMNIYPREVEDALMKHPSIEECAMVGISDGKGSEIPILYIKKKDGASVDEKTIRDYLKGHIAQFKMPRKVIFIDEFPKTATGKIKKAELRKWEHR